MDIPVHPGRLTWFTYKSLMKRKENDLNQIFRDVIIGFQSLPLSFFLMYFSEGYWLPFLECALSSAFRHTVFVRSRRLVSTCWLSNVHPLFIYFLGNISIYFFCSHFDTEKNTCFFPRERWGEKNTTSYRTEVQPTLVAARCLDIWSYICHTLTWPIGCVVCL